ncbi:YgjV family protein [Aeromonas veronii]|uniref:YgjV family protein n=1 Tax=Aeromonas veronii TaxID=654 RepID=UPI00191D7AB6|nr:YgjV family protein [Aeromonas veronii]MBL0622646.1 YgjV family protein [Aeromonas veronii]
MMSLFLWSQLVVSLALLLDLLSFQLRERRRILACLALSCVLNAGHFALLGQWSAASLLLLASVRFLVSIWLVHRILMWLFMGLACAAALATYQGLLSWIGLLATLLQTRAAFCPDDRQLRRRMLLGTLCWLGNNLLVGSPVAALMEGLFLVSNLVGYYRHYGFDYWGRGRHSGRRKRRVPPSGRATF